VRIAALQFLFLGPAIVFSTAISIAGDTMAPMMIQVITGWVLEIPLAIVLSRIGSLGQFGVPWAMVIALGLRILVYIPYFLRGSWMRKRVIEQAQPKGAEIPAP
jgi:Na+-driven multidrug efflux pump